MKKFGRFVFLSLAAISLPFSALAGNQLEYVAATTDNVLLDTGIVPSSRGTVEVKFLYLNGNNNGGIWCARGYKDTGSWNVNTFSAMCHSGGFRFDYNNSNGSAVTTVPISTTTPQIARLEAGTGTIDGTTIRSDSPADYTVGGPLCLFGTYRWRGDKTGTERYDSIGTCMIGRIYYCRVYDADGNLTNEFVPFRSSEGVVGMIDIVGNPSLDESRLIVPVQGTLVGGPEVCAHAENVDGICQSCGKDLYACEFYRFERSRDSDVFTVSGSIDAFGDFATEISATYRFGEAGQEPAVVDSRTFYATGDYSFEQTIDPNKTYRFELTFINNSPIPRTNVWEGYSFPPEELSSEFLNRLANSDARILSSPYATGGDIILQDGDDYIHVYFKTNSVPKSTFVVPKLMTATILAVGGGGGGGSRGGGGGAGGMLLSSNTMMSAGVYTIDVGAGGQEGIRNTQWARNGGDSLVAIGNSELVHAYGGGRGSGQQSHQAAAGGSGGGSMTVDVFDGIAAQGFAGGKGTGASGTSNGYDWGVGGGGGAGGPGANGTAKVGAAGGPGRTCDILGFEQAFAGGGGSGSQSGNYTTSAGGIGGGGRGSVGGYAGKGEAGTDGLGGGGGGGGNSNFSYLDGGRGGNGIVIIRYTPATGPVKPMANLYGVTTNQNGTADFDYAVGSCGSDNAVTVRLVWGYADDALRYTNTLATMVPAEARTSTAHLFRPGRSYQAALYVENDSGERSTTTASVLFTMPADGLDPTVNNPAQPVISACAVLDGTGGDYVVVTGKLSQAGGSHSFDDCQATFRWGTSNVRSQFVHVTDGTIQADGTFSFRVEGIDSTDTRYGEIEVANPSGDLDRLPASFSTADTATYRWNPAVYEGDWRDRANWIGAPNEYGLGYPTDHSVADITTADYATIYVSGVIRCKRFMKEKAYAEYVLVGTTDDAAIHSTLTGSQGGLPTAQIMTLDHIEVDFISGGTYTIGGGAQLLLQNGAKAISKRTNDGIGMAWELQGSNARIELIGGSTLSYATSGIILSGAETELIADEESKILPDAGGVANGGLVLSNGARVELASSTISSSTRAELAKKAGTDPATIVMSGSKPSLVASRILYAEFADVNFRLLMPTGGWTTARISGGTDGQARPFGVSEKGVGNRIVLTVPKTAPIRDVKTYSTRESPIVSWKAGIDLTKVAFGGTAKPDDYFYFTSTNAEKYVFCPTNSALVSTVDLPLVPVETVPTMTGIWYHHATHAAGSMMFLR